MIKKITGLLSVILMSALFSCSSDNNENNIPTPTPSSSLSATIGGNAWASIDGGAIASVTEMDVEGENVSMLQIVAIRMDQTTLTMQFPIDNLSEGTYTFSGEFAGGLLSYIPSMTGTNVYTSSAIGGSFTVTITDLNLETGTLSGTFSGTLQDMMGSGESIVITNGSINAIQIISSSMHSNGTMSLSKNNNPLFTMDATSNDGKYLLIFESPETISLSGFNNTLDADFGIYNLNFPNDITPGTYSLTANSNYTAEYNNSSDDIFDTTNGSLTITSHDGNVITGTYNYTATNGTETVTITNGSFEITHN